MKIQAEIKKAKGKNALWLLIDRIEGRTTTVNDPNALLGERSEDRENTAYPILEDEVQAIRDACEVWLEAESQRLMKEGVK